MSNAHIISVAIVDDHPLIRSCIHYLITAWGYTTILQASNGKELLSLLTEANIPDICILDINMPGMNGYETIRRLKEDWPGIRILVFSTDVVCDYALQLGADAEISKMADISELEMALTRLSNPHPGKS